MPLFHALTAKHDISGFNMKKETKRAFCMSTQSKIRLRMAVLTHLRQAKHNRKTEGKMAGLPQL